MTVDRPVRIVAVNVVVNHVLRLTFSDGSVRDVDIGPLLHGPIFEPMRNDPQAFCQVSVDPESGTVVWPNGADICPDVLHGKKASPSLNPTYVINDVTQIGRLLKF